MHLLSPLLPPLLGYANASVPGNGAYATWKNVTGNWSEINKWDPPSDYTANPVGRYQANIPHGDCTLNVTLATSAQGTRTTDIFLDTNGTFHLNTGNTFISFNFNGTFTASADFGIQTWYLNAGTSVNLSVVVTLGIGWYIQRNVFFSGNVNGSAAARIVLLGGGTLTINGGIITANQINVQGVSDVYPGTLTVIGSTGSGINARILATSAYSSVTLRGTAFSINAGSDPTTICLFTLGSLTLGANGQYPVITLQNSAEIVNGMTVHLTQTATAMLDAPNNNSLVTFSEALVPTNSLPQPVFHDDGVSGINGMPDSYLVITAYSIAGMDIFPEPWADRVINTLLYKTHLANNDTEFRWSRPGYVTGNCSVGMGGGPLAGQNIAVRDKQGVVRNAVSDGLGNYQVGDPNDPNTWHICPGNATITASGPPGYLVTSPNPVIVNVPASGGAAAAFLSMFGD